MRQLAEEAGPEGWAAEKRVLRELDLRLPQDCPYALADIAGYDPSGKDAEPDEDVWPAAVARGLNRGLGADYLKRKQKSCSTAGDGLEPRNALV